MYIQNSAVRRIFFDIETLANPEACALMAEPKAPANIKDPEKIRAAIEEKKRELIESTALDPDYGKILSIGWAVGVDGPVFVNVVGQVVQEPFTDIDGEEQVRPYQLTEEDLVVTFWEQFAQCRGSCVGYNILSFDLPYLMARSMFLGIKVPYLPNLAKFRPEPVTDLYAIRYNWGPGKGLKQVARLLGIPNGCPDVDGSKVKDLTPDQLREYQESDVRLVMEIFRKMNGIYFNL